MFCIIVKEIVPYSNTKFTLSADYVPNYLFKQFSFDSMVVRFSKFT